MSELEPRALLTDAADWLQRTAASEWLEPAGLTRSTPQNEHREVFSSKERPLVIGLFGGTGVGKSSLLNRLAGQKIARTGVVRPTSMNITAYMHEQVDVSHLPSGFPAEKLQQLKHQRTEYDNIVWVDMPDFDSDEIGNREQVLAWLPCIDILIYVVTPERYRDSQGWQLLRRDGYRHAWLFVINHWDRAEQAQFEDFRELLKTAGFVEPLIFRTDCSSDAASQDDFDDLIDVVAGLAERKLVEQLQQRGWLQRLAEMDERLATAAQTLGPGSQPGSLNESWQQIWDSLSTDIHSHIDHPLREYAGRYRTAASQKASAFRKLLGTGSQQTAISRQVAVQYPARAVWDEWLQQRVDDKLVELIGRGSDFGVRTGKLKSELRGTATQFNQRVCEQLDAALAATLAQPGSWWQRRFSTIFRWLSVLLPVAVLLWSAARVFTGFYRGVEDPAALVGFDFLINALILAGFAAALPWLLGRLFQPSIAQTIPLALKDAVNKSLQNYKNTISRQLDEVAGQQHKLLGELQQHRESIGNVLKRAKVLQDPRLNALVAGHPGDKISSPK